MAIIRRREEKALAKILKAWRSLWRRNQCNGWRRSAQQCSGESSSGGISARKQRGVSGGIRKPASVSSAESINQANGW